MSSLTNLVGDFLFICDNAFNFVLICLTLYYLYYIMFILYNNRVQCRVNFSKVKLQKVKRSRIFPQKPNGEMISLLRLAYVTGLKE